MRAPGPTWQVGSDFHAPDDSILGAWATDELPPWAGAGETVTYVESGRQALTLVSRELWRRGRTDIWIPSYFCDSMLEPFTRGGWNVHFVDVSFGLELQPPLLIPRPEASALLSLSYFGVPESSEWLEGLARWKKQGAVIISDETHRVLSRGLKLADIRIASLRKMLPLPDGGTVVGLGHGNTLIHECGVSPSELRWRAMTAKKAWLDGSGHPEFRLGFQRAEREAEGRLKPRPMSALAARLIGSFNWAEIIRRRTTNAALIAGRLASSVYRPVDFRPALPLSHLLITGPDLTSLRAHLSSNRIFCPVHWPRPKSVAESQGWPDQYLSVPIDQRYTEDDMERVAHAILDFNPRP